MSSKTKDEQRFFFMIKPEATGYGDMIARKVLNYMPSGKMGSMAPISPVMLPTQITRTPNLTISPSSPFMAPGVGILPQVNYAPSLTVSDTSPYMASAPYGSMQYQRMPLTKPCGSSLMLGPPIIKASPLLTSNVTGYVKIAIDNNVYTINVPTNYIRNIAYDIDYYSKLNKYNAIMDSAGPLAQFNLVTPTTNWPVNMNLTNTFGLLNRINSRYNGLVYKINDSEVSYNDLYNNLKNIFSQKSLPISGTYYKYSPITL